MRTLIVDDSETVRIGLSRLLESRPYCELVGAVSDPEEALAVTRTRHPHVVLQDFSMPGHDVIALVRELSACRPKPTVLMLSAFADTPSAGQARDAGAIGWVLKDAEPEHIFAALLRAAGIADAPGAAALRDGALLTAEPPAPATGPEVEMAPPDFEIATPVDARTLWAILRALEGEPVGLTVDEVASRAVIPAGTAARYLQRLGMRHAPFVVPVGPGMPRGYAITRAGRVELARLERRIPEANAHGTPPL